MKKKIFKLKNLFLIALGFAVFTGLGAAAYTALMVNSSGVCAQNVNFTGTVQLAGIEAASQFYSDDLVNTHNSSGTAHSSLFAAKQDSITASGILKGDGAGNISAAVSGTDYAAPATTLAGYGITDGMTNPMTTAGDLIYGGASGVGTRLAIGTEGYVLKISSGVPAWAAESGAVSSVFGKTGDVANISDSAGYLYNDGAGNFSYTSPAGSGDVVGPSSAVDSNLAAFDGTTGKLLKDSGYSASSFATASHTHTTSDVTDFDTEVSNNTDVTANTSARHTQNTDTGTNSDDFAFGDGTDTDKTLTANNGDANEPKLKYDSATSKWQYSNDGTTYSDIGSGGTGTDSDAIHDNVAAEISAITEKSTPAAGDWLIIEDSEASNAKKRIALSSVGNSGSGAYGQAYRTSSYTFTAVNSWEDIPLNGGDNNLVNVSHSTSTNPERMTVNKTGVYFVNYSFQAKRNSGSGHHFVGRLYKNGSAEVAGSFREECTTGSDANEVHVLTGSVIVSLSASDYLTIQAGVNLAQSPEIDVYDDGNLPDPTTTTYAIMSLTELKGGGSVEQSGWTEINTGSYTATPASTSSITMSDTSDFSIGQALKYTDSSGTFYAIVTAISTDTSITIAGAPLDTGDDLTALYAGDSSKVTQLDLVVSGTYADATGDLLAADMNTYFKWQGTPAYLVSFSAVQKTVDSTSQPTVNVKINGSAVSSAGVQLSTAGTWVDNSAVAITTANYDINRGEAIEINCSTAGGAGDAEDLTVSCVFVNK